ncbi:hypothetical protein SteCoe_20995 [Stentor coeruleus]|uniref:Protein kinase domain-containing protein n=1 Tax=Stentor coeruleus TaxID=5963 RepID=A0A1R2BQR7_9CILI|nr:hypothetical protein SteCoe_20995 [Stentor coeruleus]
MGSCSTKHKNKCCFTPYVSLQVSEWPNLTFVEVVTLKLIFKDLASRNRSETRLNKVNFLSFFNIHGILGEKLFSQFDLNNKNYIESNDFIRGIIEYCRVEYSQVLKKMFELFKFNKSEIIKHKELTYLFHNFMKEFLDKRSQKNEDNELNTESSKSPNLGTSNQSTAYSSTLLLSEDFAESITKQFSHDAKGLTYADFENFIEKYPEVYSNFARVFREPIWKDYSLTNADFLKGFHNDTMLKEFFCGDILLYINEGSFECFGTIRENLFIVFDSDKLVSVIDAIFLKGCYLNIDENKCMIFQYTTPMPRMTFEPRSRYKIDDWEQQLKKSGDIKKFRDLYELGYHIGHGKFSVVYTALEKNTNKTWAVKIMKRKITNSIERELIHNEINILKILNHQNIVKMKDTFLNSSRTLIIEEFLDGGSLENYVGLLTENDIKIVAKQLLDVISYIHEVGVIHRDIKLDNVLLAEKSDIMTVKLVDFGLSIFAMPGKILNGVCGTVGYTAPEIYSENGYGNKVDIWSLGVLIYVMLAKKMPFRGNCNQDIIEATINREPDFEELASFSPQAMEFVKKLLRKNPKERPRAVNARKHEWFDS